VRHVVAWGGEHELAVEALGAADVLAAGLGETEPALVWEHAMLGYDGARVLANTERFGRPWFGWPRRGAVPATGGVHRGRDGRGAARAGCWSTWTASPRPEQALNRGPGSPARGATGPRQQLAALLDRIKS